MISGTWRQHGHNWNGGNKLYKVQIVVREQAGHFSQEACQQLVGEIIWDIHCNIVDVVHIGGAVCHKLRITNTPTIICVWLILHWVAIMKLTKGLAKLTQRCGPGCRILERTERERERGEYIRTECHSWDTTNYSGFMFDVVRDVPATTRTPRSLAYWTMSEMSPWV